MDERVELLTELVRRYRVPGAQLAVYEHGVLTQVEVGHVRAGGEPVAPDSLFPLGSVTKFVTATLVLQLVGDGDLELDEPIATWLPELRGGTPGSATVRQLLSHTSGLPDMVGAEVRPGASLRAHVLAGRGEELVCEPGKTFSYSNFGYVVAGYLVEQITGMRWAEAVRSFLLDPLGVPGGVLSEPGPGITQHAVHLPTGAVQVVEPEVPLAVVPAGALTTTAAGLLTLALPHCGGLPADMPILEPAQIEEMGRTIPGAEPFGLANAWGLGLAGFDRQWLGHDGNTGGATCTLRIHPATGTALVLMTNATSGRQLADRFLDDLAARGFGPGAYHVPDPGTPLSGKELRAAAAELTGRYRSGGRVIDVRAEESGELVLQQGHGGGSRLTLYPNLVFQIAGKAGERTAPPESPEGLRGDEFTEHHRFLRTADGRITGVQYAGGRVVTRV
ncbi:serine hydrolase [Amycolatopsis sp. 195334CR]|uniref:serine hydrolase domain-containing protein n=1 Tax=Amycolatopsis sp. 195334CR TaxID=2814588 RepID=UPI001A8F9A47|nr:serine hydrolase domain-containing protein [Amycolatopsis sp. 195334CR]MBN6039801.1 beta-lactamase family protein [Amycolatopsis sp. 195334CR]